MSTDPAPDGRRVALNTSSLERAARIRIRETGAVWWRIFGGPFDGMWTDHDGTAVRGGRKPEWLAEQGTVVVEETL